MQECGDDIVLAAHMLRSDCLLPFSLAEQIIAMPVQRASIGRWTEEEFYAGRDAAPAGERWELVDGEVLVTPSPHWVHQRIIGRLHEHLAAYTRATAVGEVFLSPLDVRLEVGLVLQPDLFVVPAGELRKRTDVIRRHRR